MSIRIRWRRDEVALARPIPVAVRKDSTPRDIRAAFASALNFKFNFKTAVVWAAVGLIVLVAFFARNYNTNWDQGAHLHPDERFMTSVTAGIKLPSSPSDYFDTSRTKFNPYNPPASTGSFVYGTLPLFMAKFVAVVRDKDDYDNMVLVGRHLTALFDAMTVLLVFLIGRRLYGSAAGLLAAILYGAAPLAIQHAHFFIVDSYLTTFTTASLYFSIRAWQDKRPVDCALAGVMLGLGMACKITALIITPVVLAAILWQLVTPARRLWTEHMFDDDALAAIRSTMLGVGLAGFLAFFAFRIAQPYAFNAPSLSHPEPWSLSSRWLKDQKQQSALLSGNAAFPPSIQWIGRTSYIYPFTEMTKWGAGPALSLAGWLTAAYAAYRLLRHNDQRHLLPLIFLVAYFGFMGRQFSLYLRYFLPLYPVLAALAGYGLVTLVDRIREVAMRYEKPRLSAVGYALAGLVVVVGVLAGAAYFSIYSQPVTRLEASRWIYQNVPANASIAQEHWDETVPMQLPAVAPRNYKTFDLKLYDPDSPDKIRELIDDLTRADYITMSSNRLINSIPRNRINYPLTIQYYKMLFDGSLGFTLVHESTDYPRLFGIEFPDYKAQESESSYDHPRVLVFKKNADFSRTKLQDTLGLGPFSTGTLTPAQADKNGLMLRAADLKTQEQGGTWSSIFSSHGIASVAPTFVWLLAIEAAALAALPLLFLVCNRLPDRGYLLSKPLGLLLVAYPVWLGASLKLIHFDQTSILVSLFALMAIGGVITAKQRRPLLEFLKANWHIVLISEVVFLIAFFAFREIRMANPDLWHPARGGEKPMDLAYLTAVARSTTMPPYDPWFSGGYINYYFFGQYLTATMLKLTTIPPEIGYNLAVPTYFAMLLGGAFSVAYNLAAFARTAVRRTARMRPIPGWSVIAAGLLGAVFVAVAGNLDGVDQMLDRLEKVSTLHVNTPLPVVDGLINAVGGIWQVVINGKHLAPFDFWRSSRMMPPTIAITEFPYWSFLFADLHAHMMALPFEMLTLGICLSQVLSKPGESQPKRDWAVVVLLGLLVGSLRWLNSWDYPPFLLVAMASIGIGERHLDGGWWATGKRVIFKVGALGLLSFLLFKPFLDSYATPVAGLHPSPEQTPIEQYLAHFGAFLAVIGAWLVFLTIRALRASPLVHGMANRGQQIWIAVGSLIFFIVSLVTFATILRGYALVGVLVPFLALVLYLAARELWQRRPDAGPRLFILTLVALGLGLSMGVDLVTLDGDIIRMNTVFKFYEHIWLAFAVSASYAAWYLVFVIWQPLLTMRRVFRMPGSFAPPPPPEPVWTPQSQENFGALFLGESLAELPASAFAPPPPPLFTPSRPKPAPRSHGTGSLPRVLALGSMAGFGLLLGAILLYPAFATKPRLDDRFTKLPPTLDGEAYMKTAVYTDEKGNIDLNKDLEGIEWMRQNVKGSPPIVEGRTPLYRWGGRFSIYTGLPAVLGWDFHQTQQRGKLGFMIGQRAGDIDTFYGNPNKDTARAFLRQYGVQYVIVGQIERLYYPPEGIAKFSGGLDGVLDVVFQNDQLRIYQVNTAKLTDLLASRSHVPLQPPPGNP